MRTFEIKGIMIEQTPSGSSFFLWRNHEQTLSQLGTRQTVVTRQAQHGTTSGTQFYGGRPLPFAVEIVGTPSEVESKREAIKIALGLGQHTGTLDSDKTIEVFAAQPQFTTTNDPRILLCEFTLRADDPFFYSTTENTVNGAEKAVGGGYTLQEGDLPKLPTTLQETALESVSITTTSETPPVFTITGETTNPIIRHLGTGEEIAFTFDGGLSLGPDDTLVVDVKSRTALLNGESVTGKLTPATTWFNLQSGSNSISLFDGENPITANLSVSYRERYL